MLDLLRDHRDALLQAHVAPAQPRCLPAPQPAQGDQVARGVETVVAAVPTTARGRRAAGNSTRAAGLSEISPRRRAALRVIRGIARIRFRVAAVNGVPRAGCSRAMRANIACRRETDNSASCEQPSTAAVEE
ncbi:hypothetical protein ACFY4C_13950 [Actinomadura viridis]|uniref:hypothetical protein n=1 Tax=Actinomadura viridis TaxID=58110 RepID=UPI0036A304C9